MNLIDYDEAEKILPYKKTTLRKKVMNREIPFLKIGRRVFFDKEELEAWLESKRVPVKSQEEK